MMTTTREALGDLREASRDLWEVVADALEPLVAWLARHIGATR